MDPTHSIVSFTVLYRIYFWFTYVYGFVVYTTVMFGVINIFCFYIALVIPVYLLPLSKLSSRGRQTCCEKTTAKLYDCHVVFQAGRRRQIQLRKLEV